MPLIAQAAELAANLVDWEAVEPRRSRLLKAQLERLAATKGLSSQVGRSGLLHRCCCTAALLLSCGMHVPLPPARQGQCPATSCQHTRILQLPFFMRYVFLFRSLSGFVSFIAWVPR